MKYTVFFVPDQKSIKIDHPENLMKICQMAEIPLDVSCNGRGTCGKCKVQIQNGTINPPGVVELEKLTPEEVESGFRLACQCMVDSDLTVFVSKMAEGSHRKRAMHRLPDHFWKDFRENDGWNEDGLKKNAWIEAEADNNGQGAEYNYGCAFDIGTTTMVGMLWNLSTGECLGSQARTNPQRAYGPDVISRIQYCMESSKEEEHTKKMHQLLMDSCNEIIAILCEDSHISKEEITKIVAVGNTTMSHFFLGYNPKGLAKAPFSPMYTGEAYFSPKDIGILLPSSAEGYMLPNIAGHVGSDLTAVMLASNVAHLPGKTVIVDIGTNGEIMVASDGEMKVCSTAAGPALEGASITAGVRASYGAIEGIRIEEDIFIKTIEDGAPTGICGSGIIDVISELLRSGLVLSNGNLLTKEAARENDFSDALVSRLYGEGAGKGMILAKKEDGSDIVFTQKDIREIQLAKGAIAAGILTLVHKFAFDVSEIDRVIIAGAFGNYIKKESALRIGLLPGVDPDKVEFIGNGAGTGAAMALLSEKKRKEASELVQKIQHIELSQDPDFQDIYLQEMMF